MKACRIALLTLLLLVGSCNYRVVSVDSNDTPSSSAKERTVIYIYEKGDQVGQRSYVPMGLPSGAPFGPPPALPSLDSPSPPPSELVETSPAATEVLADDPKTAIPGKVVCKPFVLPKHPQMPPIPEISARDQEDPKKAAAILVGTLGKMRVYVRNMVQTNENAYLNYRRDCQISDEDSK